MNYKMSRVSLIKTLNKKQLLNLLGSILSFEELESLLNFNSKEQVLKIISSIHTREELNDIVNSNLNISTDLIFNYYKNTFICENQNQQKEKNNEFQLFTEIIKVGEPFENKNINSNSKNENKISNMENNLGNSKTNFEFENKISNIENNLGNLKMKTEKKNVNEKPFSQLGKKNDETKKIILNTTKPSELLEPIDLPFENLDNEFIIHNNLKNGIQNKKFGVIQEEDTNLEIQNKNAELPLPMFRHRRQNS